MIGQLQTELGREDYLPLSEAGILQLDELKSRIWLHVLIGCQDGNWGRPHPRIFQLETSRLFDRRWPEATILRSTNASAKYEREVSSLHGDVIFAIDNCGKILDSWSSFKSGEVAGRSRA